MLGKRGKGEGKSAEGNRRESQGVEAPCDSQEPGHQPGYVMVELLVVNSWWSFPQRPTCFSPPPQGLLILEKGPKSRWTEKYIR